jgi:hypothetical protein
MDWRNREMVPLGLATGLHIPQRQRNSIKVEILVLQCHWLS